jgi:hypothetical protein
MLRERHVSRRPFDPHRGYQQNSRGGSLDAETQASLEEICQAVKLLAVTVKAAGYSALAGEEARLEQFTREIERVCLFADKIIQRIHRDNNTLAGYPAAETGNLSSDEG